MKCITDGCDKDNIFAKGLCQGCYNRLRRKGTVQRTNVINSGKCSETGCEKPAFSKNLCKRHYDVARHPLKTPWVLLRSRNPGQFPTSWDRFEAFLSDVGDRPTPRHQLRRIDATQPYSADNFKWFAPVLSADCYTPEDRKRYEREWRLQRKFGISGADYDRMFAEQNGLCAICRKPERQVHRKTGKLRDLAVDHDHTTLAIRGLVCTDHNMMIGLATDDPDLLEAAAAYLRRHRGPHFVPGMTLIATLPTELGAITGLREENGSIVASSESGVDYIIPANKLPKGTGEAAGHRVEGAVTIEIGRGLRFPEHPKIQIAPALMGAMQIIARGRIDNGRPIGGEEARQLMREAMTKCGIEWFPGESETCTNPKTPS